MASRSTAKTILRTCMVESFRRTLVPGMAISIAGINRHGKAISGRKRVERYNIRRGHSDNVSGCNACPAVHLQAESVAVVDYVGRVSGDLVDWSHASRGHII